MQLLFGHDAEVAEFVHRLIPHMPTGFKDFAAIGSVRNGELIGGVVFHEFRGNDIQISCAATSKYWLNNEAIRQIFRYPFIQLGCDRVTSFTPKSAANTRRFLLGFGFVEEGNMRRGFRNDDCMVYGLLREECKWIRD